MENSVCHPTQYFDEETGEWEARLSPVHGDTVIGWLDEGRWSDRNIRTAVADADMREALDLTARARWLAAGVASAEATELELVNAEPPGAASPVQNGAGVSAASASEEQRVSGAAGVLGLAQDAVVALGAFAEEHQFLAEMSVGAAQVAFGGPVRGIVRRVAEMATGEAVNKIETALGASISGLLQDHLHMAPEQADLLGQTGVFGMSVIFGGGAKQLVEQAVDIKRRTRGGTYVLRDPETGTVMRSGRTRNLARREREHRRDPALRDLDFDPVHHTDDNAARRGLEQMLHDEHSPTLNRIRPIDPANPRRDAYMDAARRHIEEEARGD